MMKSVLLTTLVASAAAFAPTSQKSSASSTSLSADFSKELGAQAPLGFFDPLNLLEDSSQEYFDRLRYVEIKHGRIAMVAVVGFLVQEAGIRFPGNIAYDGPAFADIPNGFAGLAATPNYGLAQIGLFIFAMEVGFMRDVTGKNAFPGDFRNDYIDFGWDKLDDATKMKKRAIELNNGRAAQMGILGLMVHTKLGNLDTILP